MDGLQWEQGSVTSVARGQTKALHASVNSHFQPRISGRLMVRTRQEFIQVNSTSPSESLLFHLLHQVVHSIFSTKSVLEILSPRLKSNRRASKLIDKALTEKMIFNPENSSAQVLQTFNFQALPPEIRKLVYESYFAGPHEVILQNYNFHKIGISCTIPHSILATSTKIRAEALPFRTLTKPSNSLLIWGRRFWDSKDVLEAMERVPLWFLESVSIIQVSLHGMVLSLWVNLSELLEVYGNRMKGLNYIDIDKSFYGAFSVHMVPTPHLLTRLQKRDTLYRICTSESIWWRFRNEVNDLRIDQDIFYGALNVRRKLVFTAKYVFYDSGWTIQEQTEAWKTGQILSETLRVSHRPFRCSSYPRMKH